VQFHGHLGQNGKEGHAHVIRTCRWRRRAQRRAGRQGRGRQGRGRGCRGRAWLGGRRRHRGCRRFWRAGIVLPEESLDRAKHSSLGRKHVTSQSAPPARSSARWSESKDDATDRVPNDPRSCGDAECPPAWRPGLSLRACLKNLWLPRARSRPSSFVLGFAGNFEDEDETRTECSDTF
jgi:hypothetical protein